MIPKDRDVLNALPADAVAAAKKIHPLPSAFKLTELGNAERLVARHRDRIRYCYRRRKWLVWDGKRWVWDDGGLVTQLGKQTVRGIYGEAEHETDKDRREAISKWAIGSEKSQRIRAMIELAQSEPGIPVQPSELDSDPWLLNCANGTIDLRTGELREHRRSDLITRMTSVEYQPEARSELWDSVLATVTNGDAELAAYLQRVFGYALQGTASEKRLFFVYGMPDTGKSTLLLGVGTAFGEYHETADAETWCVRTNTGGNRGDVVRLAGARLVTVVEIRKGSRFDESLIKKATGGDEITAAAKYESEVTFRPQFALVFAANDAPIVRDDDQGMWSRMVRVPFEHAIPPGMRDPQLPQKLAAPEVQTAILAWAVKGCLAWQRDGLGTATAIERSTAEYRQEMDRAGGFFADCCKFSGDAECWISSKSLREAYESWCHENGVRKPLIAKELAERLQARGCTARRTGRARIWQGVRLLDPDESPDGDVVTRVTPPTRKFSRRRIQEDFTETAVTMRHQCHTHNPCEQAERVAIHEHGGG